MFTLNSCKSTRYTNHAKQRVFEIETARLIVRLAMALGEFQPTSTMLGV